MTSPQLETPVTVNCVHGFNPEHCTSCRTCRHGLITSRCARCMNPVAQRAADKILPPAEPSQEHRGHEVYFVPAQRSWYFRDSPDVLPRESYRSAFLAKRAIDSAVDSPPRPSKGSAKHR